MKPTPYNISKILKIGLFLGVTLMSGVFYSRALDDTPNISVWTDQPADATVCGDAITFTVHIKNTSTEDIENIKVYPQLPEGVTYVPGTAQLQGGTALSEIDPTGANPGFVVPGSLSVEAGSDEAVITFKAKAHCAIIDNLQSAGSNVVSNNTKVEFNLLSEGASAVRTEFEANGSTSYNILYPTLQYYVNAGDDNLSLVDPAQVLNRHFTLKNSGNGALSKFTLYADYDQGIDYQKLYLMINNVETELTPTSITATQAQYDIDLEALGMSALAPNGELYFTDELKVVDFKPSMQTEYYARWGCDGAVCNSTDAESAFMYITTAGYPQLSMTTNSLTSESSFCGGNPYITENIIQNSGSGNSPEILDAAYDLKLFIYVPAIINGSVKVYLQAIDGNNNVGSEVDLTPYLQSTSTGNYTVDPNSAVFKIDDGVGGLEDLDNDSYFNDLPVGSKIKIRIENSIALNQEWDLSQYSEFYTYKFTQFICHYNDWEGDVSSLMSNYNDGFRILNRTNNITGSPDLSPGTETTLNFNFGIDFNSLGTKEICANGIYEVKFTLPPGVRISSLKVNGNVVSTDNLITDGNNVNTLDYFNTSEIVPINYELGLTIDDCSVTTGSTLENLKWQLFYYCNPTSCAQGDIKLVDQNTDVIMHCADCSTTFETTDFKMERTTFGWKENSYNSSRYFYKDLFGPNATAQKVDKNTPGVKLDAAYPNDHVQITIDGQLNGNAPYDNVHASISYKSPKQQSFLDFVDGNFLINGQSYSVSAPIVTQDAGDPTLYNLEFTLGGITLSGGENIDFVGDFKVPNQPLNDPISDQYIVFRGSVFGLDGTNTEQGCVGYGQGFHIYKPRVNGGGYSYLPCDMNYPINFVPLYSATQGDDFPNEFRPIFYPEKIKVTLPTGYQFNRDLPVTHFAMGTTELTNISYTDNDQTITIAPSPKMQILDLKYKYQVSNVRTYLQKNLDYTPTGNTISFNVSMNGNYYLNSDGSFINSESIQTDNLIDRTYNDIILTANKTQDAIGKTVSWPVQLCNSTSNAYQLDPNNNWVAVELRPDDNSTILEGATDNAGNSLNTTFYGPVDENHPQGAKYAGQDGDGYPGVMQITQCIRKLYQLCYRL